MSLSSLRQHRSVWLGVAAVVAILAAAVVFGALGPDSEPAPTQAPLLAITEQIPLGPGAREPEKTIATDGDSPGDNTAIWSIGGEGREGVAERLDLSDTKPRRQDFRVNLGNPSPQRVLDIGEWATGTAVFDLRLERGGVRSRVLSLGPRRRVESRGFARLPRPLVKREVAIATWSGPAPDLFVIDRGGARERVRITVFSGESGFVLPITTKRAPFKQLDPDEWTLDVGQLGGRRPSLVGFSRSGTGSGRPELHVLTGDSDFQEFVVQRPVDRPRSATLSRLVTGLSLGRPSVFFVEGRRLLTVPLGAPQ